MLNLFKCNNVIHLHMVDLCRHSGHYNLFFIVLIIIILEIIGYNTIFFNIIFKNIFMINY